MIVPIIARSRDAACQEHHTWKKRRKSLGRKNKGERELTRMYLAVVSVAFWPHNEAGVEYDTPV